MFIVLQTCFYLKTDGLVNFQWCVCISGAPAVYMYVMCTRALRPEVRMEHRRVRDVEW